MKSPLAEFPITSTSDPDEAQAILSRELSDLRILSVKEPSRFRLDMHGVHLGQTLVAFNHFGADTVIDPDHVPGAVLFIVGTGRPSIFNVGKEMVACTERGVIVSPSKPIRIRRPIGGGTLVLRARFEAVEHRLQKFLDNSSTKPIYFPSSVDFERGAGARLRSLVNHLMQLLGEDSTLLESPMMRRGFDDLLLNALLDLPNNYSEALADESGASTTPRVVRLAEEYLEAHATEPVSIEAVVVYCGTSRSALFSAFRRHRGYSPGEFLEGVRLSAANEALRSARFGDTVSSVAHECGFPHLGRFAAAYKRMFGESPSATLRRREQDL